MSRIHRPCMTLKFRLDRMTDEHARFTVFIASQGETFANCGQLCATHAEYWMLKMVMAVGEAMYPAHLKFETDESILAKNSEEKETES